MADFLDAPDAVHERVPVEEQQAPALLGVAVVVEVNLQRMQEIGLVFAVVVSEPLERGMQHARCVDSSLYRRYEGIKARRLSGFDAILL